MLTTTIVSTQQLYQGNATDITLLSKHTSKPLRSLPNFKEILNASVGLFKQKGGPLEHDANNVQVLDPPFAMQTTEGCPSLFE